MQDGGRTTGNGRCKIACRLSSLVLCSVLALTAQSARGGEEPAPGLDLSTKKDALRAIDQGIQWLKARQKTDGSWPPSSQPTVTAFATRAILLDPAREQGGLDASAAKGLGFIASLAQSDGGLCRSLRGPAVWSDWCSYTTAVAMLTFAESREARCEPLMLASRRFLVRTQNRQENSERFGGWSPDVEITAFAIKALAATERISIVDSEKNHSAPADPDWAAAAAFLSRCQNRTGPQPQEFGGFFNGPGQGSVAAEKGATGRPARDCEGAVTALGLTALLECNVARSDPRVLGAVQWIRSHYTLDGEPSEIDSSARRGLGRLYFYYYALAEALSLYGEEPLLRPGGRAADWRRELMIKLISLQRTDSQGLGYWVNDQGEEKDPVLVTAYCVLTLETLADEPAY